MMYNGKKLELEELKEATEREILMYVKKNGQSAYGEVIKNLKLSYHRGQQCISLLVSKGYLRFVERTSNLELA